MNPTPSSASPVKPILPGVPVAFPCWLWHKDVHPESIHGGFWQFCRSEEDFRCTYGYYSATYYLDAPATADPATFPKAEQPVPEAHAMGLVTSAERLHLAISVFLKDWRDGDFQLSELAAIHALAIEKKYLEVGRALKAGNDAFLEFQAMLSAPSAGTEQKERGHPGADKCQKCGKLIADHSESRIWECASAAPTDRLTTPPRTEEIFGDKAGEERRRGHGAYELCCQLENELMTLTARLALTEKRLGEAQHEADGLQLRVNFLGEDVKNEKMVHRITRAQLATSQARLVEVEKERDEYRAIMVQVVPGEHGEGVEQPASPEHIKAHIDYLQKEWDVAESALAQAKQEVEQREKTLEAYRKRARNLYTPEVAATKIPEDEAHMRNVDKQLEIATAALRYFGLEVVNAPGEGIKMLLTGEDSRGCRDCAYVRVIPGGEHAKDQSELTILRAANTAFKEQLKAAADYFKCDQSQLCAAIYEQFGEVAAISAQVEELKRDGERLDWLEANEPGLRHNIGRTLDKPETIREAVDAALRPQGGQDQLSAPADNPT